MSSSTTTTSTAETQSGGAFVNNPFLQIFKKSSFLFGGDSDFQSAEFFDSEEIGDVLYIDGDEDDSSTDDSSMSLGEYMTDCQKFVDKNTAW